jgi:hypothetical protein
MVSIALRAGIALGRAGATDCPGKGECSERGWFRSDSPSWRLPEAKKIQGKAITCRCTSKERRAASHGEINQNMTIPPCDHFPIRLQVEADISVDSNVLACMSFPGRSRVRSYWRRTKLSQHLPARTDLWPSALDRFLGVYMRAHDRGTLFATKHF